MINKTTNDSTPTLELPSTKAQKDKMSGPKKSANLPKMSKNPKYSLASFFGISFPHCPQVCPQDDREKTLSNQGIS